MLKNSFLRSRNSMRQAVRSFHEDDDGLTTLEITIILAIAALLLVIVLKFGQEYVAAVIDFMRKKLFPK